MSIYGEDAGMDLDRDDYLSPVLPPRSGRRDSYLPGISSSTGRSLNMAAAKLRSAR